MVPGVDPFLRNPNCVLVTAGARENAILALVVELPLRLLGALLGLSGRRSAEAGLPGLQNDRQLTASPPHGRSGWARC